MFNITNTWIIIILLLSFKLILMLNRSRFSDHSVCQGLSWQSPCLNPLRLETYSKIFGLVLNSAHDHHQYHCDYNELNIDACVFSLFWFVTGDLEAFKKQAFVLKEGVEYKIKISFKVRAAVATAIQEQWSWNIRVVWELIQFDRNYWYLKSFCVFIGQDNQAEQICGCL